MIDPVYNSTAPDEESPFVIEHLRLDARPDTDHFTPGARLLLTRALRTSGLLLALPESELKSLLFLLTFLTPNGRCEAGVPALASAMHISPAKVRARMGRLAEFVWQGKPLVSAIHREGGWDSFVPSTAVLTARQAPPETEASAPPPLSVAGREAVIAHSRAMYARPRKDVERMIAEQLGHGGADEGEGPEAELRMKLHATGLRREEVGLLLARYPQERIERQLEWLPYRNAKSPARLLVAAIEGDYEPPLALRLRQAAAAPEEPDSPENENDEGADGAGG